MYARVAVERGIERAGRGADAGLTYRVEGEPVRVGQRVAVPLGRSGRAVWGFVVEVGGPELCAGLHAGDIKRIGRVVGEGLSPRLMDLAKWISRYDVAPLGMVLAAMVPSAVKKGTGARSVEVVAAAPAAPAEGLRKRAAALVESMRALPVEVYPITLKELAGRVGLKSTAALKGLIKRGVLQVSRVEQVHAGTVAGLAEGDGAGPGPALVLTAEQAEAIAAIERQGGKFGVHLLRGVTGSGKTEVYLRLIEGVLARGATAIVLVPEIALTPQTSARFVQRFGRGAVAVLHSGLSAAQRHREWRRAAEGKARVVVGARSAVFSPCENVGLIVVDEEHDSSYKQDQLPRYHARDVAIKRAQLEGCPVVLGSATPSLESWAHTRAGDDGRTRSTLHELTTRVPGASLPEARIVDLAEERRARGRDPMGEPERMHLIGPTLEREMVRALGEGSQVLLLLNRRGFAHYIACPAGACGFVLMCDQCDSALVLHRHTGAPGGSIVRCHHCLTDQKVPVLCPACGRKMATLGGGTQRLEEEVERKFGALGVRSPGTMARLDSDTARTARDYFGVLSRFGAGELRVLLGTQMIAKGLDFPGVGLVGVIDADTALALPDFRSAERTFQLVSQVAGRAGRGERAGLVIIQTYNPEHPAIRLAAAHDYAAFAEAELETRGRAWLPPVSRMARIVCRDEIEEKARQRAGELCALLRSAGGEHVRVADPVPCVVSRIAGQHRVGVEILAWDAGTLSRVLNDVRTTGRLRSDAKTAVDVDPVALM